MSFNTWTPLAVSSEAQDWQGSVWRVVEAQHTASTMKLVDRQEEQDVLELLLEGSKPLLAHGTERLDYLLATPFRYPSLRGGSRFRSALDPGVFYAAQSVRTACAELAYWRWRFLLDAVDLAKLEPVAHTAFSVDVASQVVDLRRAPFAQQAEIWRHPTDYHATQAFARVARQAGLGAIMYQSVRDPDPAWCIALLSPLAFAQTAPQAVRQTWWLSVQQEQVLWRRDGEAMRFAADGW